jgi:D-alanyl-D-alanine-carboxypeptidase/D-alanyl-D-alanine-endopeptidase
MLRGVRARRVALVFGLAACEPAAIEAPPRVSQEAPPVEPRSATEAPVDRQALVDALVGPAVASELLIGVSVGVIAGGVESTHHYGTRRLGEDAPPDDDTIYEVGSISKVFTAGLLADMVVRGEVSLATPLAEALPGAQVPGGQAMTLLDLTTHTSGLPPLPLHLLIRGGLGNDFAFYTTEHLLADLKDMTLIHAPGDGFAYSNFGAAVLGAAISARAGASYDELLRARLAGPLGMHDTAVALDAQQAARAATGHFGGVAAAAGNIGALAPAGEVRSTVRDMLRFVRANLEPAPEAVRLALWETHAPRRKVDDRQQIGLGWMIAPSGVRWHNGQIGGFHGFVALDPAAGRGVVLLSNADDALLDQLGGALMKRLAGEDAPVELPPVQRRSPEELAPYVGEYAQDGTSVRVTREGHRLYVEMTGLPARVRLHAIGEHRFVERTRETTVAFRVDGGAARELVVESLFPLVYPRVAR